MKLDCYNFESTLVSLESFLCVDKSEILDRFSKFDLSAVEHKYYDEDIAFELFDLFPERCEALPYSSVCWFHFTRSQHAYFSQGLLPLNMVIEPIWKLLGEIARNARSTLNWDSFRKWMEEESTCHYANLYRDKLHKESKQYGPFGVLIRECAFVPNADANHCLSAPEIVVDICYTFKERYQIDLLEMYQRITSPCIVKFEDVNIEWGLVKVAALYAYDRYNNRPNYIGSNSCFDSYGEIIPRTRILEIEILDDDYNFLP